MASQPPRFSWRKTLSRRKATKEKTPSQQTYSKAGTSAATEDVPQTRMPQAVKARPSELGALLTETSLPAADNQIEMFPSERLLNEAYDRVKRMEPALVQAYERIISSQISDENGSLSETLKSHEATVDESLPSSLKMMTLVVEKKLKNADKQAGMTKAGGTPLNSMIDSIKTAIQVSPNASLAWSGVLLALGVRPAICLRKS
jgi:NWD NACHT NTPase-like protein